MKKHFAAGYQKVGTFAIRWHPRIGLRKVGGNVAAYFCTPDLRVLGAVGGPVPAEVFLREAERAVALAEQTQGGLTEDAGSFVELSHQARMGTAGLWNDASLRDRSVYEILAAHPLGRLERIYPEVFVTALRQRLSDDPVTVEERRIDNFGRSLR